MNRYLLLRDNKESGPYTVAELAAKGVKAYDLVWLEGKSAAWRYPSEIEELRPYSPVVEEQPYDRFYKKPEAAKSKNTTAADVNQPVAVEHAALRDQVINHTMTGQVAIDAYKPRPVINQETPLPGRKDDKSIRPAVILPQPLDSSASRPTKIFVTLPGGSASTDNSRINQNNKPEVAANPVSSPVSDSSIDAETLNARFTAVHQNAVRFSENTQTEKFAEEKAGNVTGYNSNIERHISDADNLEKAGDIQEEPLRDFVTNQRSRFSEDDESPVSRRRNVKKVLAGSTAGFGKRETAKVDSVATHGLLNQFKASRFNTRTAVTILTGICLLLGGVVIGLVISNQKNSAAKELDAVVKRIQEREQNAGKSVDYTEPNTTADVVAAPPESQVPVDEQEPLAAAAPAKSGSKFSSQPAEKKLPENQVSVTPVQNTSSSESAVESTPTVVRESSTRAQTASAKNAEIKNIRSMMVLDANDYKTGVLGGISGLELIITNNSPVDVDKVIAEVEYLGPEKRVVKTQTIIFNNIKAGQQKRQEVPKTNRGVSVNYSIKSVQTRATDVAASDL